MARRPNSSLGGMVALSVALAVALASLVSLFSAIGETGASFDRGPRARTAVGTNGCVEGIEPAPVTARATDEGMTSEAGQPPGMVPALGPAERAQISRQIWEE